MAWLHLRNLHKIRKYLTEEATLTLVHAFVTSKIDLYNCLLHGLPVIVLDKLQKVLNAAAKLVLGGRKYDSATPLLKKLHWLSIKERIEFKILLLTFKSLNGKGPEYLRNLLKKKTPQKTLISASDNLLHEPRTSLITYGDRAFQSSAPKLWNALPNNIKNSKNLDNFKQLLKTHLFERSYKD